MCIRDRAFCRPTGWREFSVDIPALTGRSGAEFFAGGVNPGKKKTKSGKLVQVSDSSAELITAVWDRDLGARVPYYSEEVFRGDVLNHRIKKDMPIHLVNPIDSTVRRLDEHDTKTDAMVVDIMGGEKLPIRSLLSFSTPGEVLIMDGSGKFRVQNSLSDAVNYRLSLLKEDDSNQLGRERRTDPDDDDRGDGGGFGG